MQIIFKIICPILSWAVNFSKYFYPTSTHSGNTQGGTFVTVQPEGWLDTIPIDGERGALGWTSKEAATRLDPPPLAWGALWLNVAH